MNAEYWKMDQPTVRRRSWSPRVVLGAVATFGVLACVGIVTVQPKQTEGSSHLSTAVAGKDVVDMSQVNASFVRLNSDVKHAESNFWKNPATHLVQKNEVEMVKGSPPKVNKIIYLFLAMWFGCCGFDRCFMGQICLGFLKGFTFGGFFIWNLIDYIVCVVSCLSKDKDINTLVGLPQGTFEEGSINIAFYICIILLVLNIWQQYRSYKQIQLQQQQQATMVKSMNEARGKQAQQPADESLDIPTRHQSLAYIPTALTRNLRKAGLVAEKPTIPELIAAFDTMDKNKDGLLDREEIKEGMKAMGATDETVEEMIKTADTDGDGQINKNEFLVAYHAKP